MDLKIKDVAELLHVSETTIRRWLTDRKIPAYRINGQFRFSRLEIENWMMGCKLTTPEEPFTFHSSEEGSAKGGMQHFCLYRAIHQGDTFVDVKGGSKEEVIRETTQRIAPKLGVDPEVLAELLMDREKMMPTAIHHGIAVPHTRDFLRKDLLDMVFVVYPEAPIDYGALDQNSVHTLFFLFAGNDKGHLQTLAKLAHLSSNPKLVTFLQQRPEKKELLEAIRDWEAAI